MRAAMLTTDDLAETTAVLEALDRADEALRDLRERCLRKNDDLRAGRLRVALSRLGEARELTEQAFR